jgi:hypothetical protein
MKIVKMHKGSREAFDDFLAQRLNEVEIDNDAADKYFADMNLPVPVIPATEISFLAKHKNKLWLLLFLCITSISTYLLVNNKNTTLQETETAKNKNVLDNGKVKSNKNISQQKNTFSKEEEIFKTNSENTLANTTGVAVIDKGSNKKSVSTIEKNSSIFLLKNKHVVTKMDALKASNSFDTATMVQKANEIIFDKKDISITVPTNTSKPLPVDKKTATADSLYIIW